MIISGNRTPVQGSTETWTRIAGFRVLCANHYTIEPCYFSHRFSINFASVVRDAASCQQSPVINWFESMHSSVAYKGDRDCGIKRAYQGSNLESSAIDRLSTVGRRVIHCATGPVPRCKIDQINAEPPVVELNIELQNWTLAKTRNILWTSWVTTTWLEHAPFWSGVRRATIAPRSPYPVQGTTTKLIFISEG